MGLCRLSLWCLSGHFFDMRPVCAAVLLLLLCAGLSVQGLRGCRAGRYARKALCRAHAATATITPTWAMGARAGTFAMRGYAYGMRAVCATGAQLPSS